MSLSKTPKRPMISKTQRQEVYAKSDGHCWYCGCDLPDRWHVDHVEAVRRDYEGLIDPAKAHLHTLDNFVPSCPSCNIFKSISDLEGFRRRIGDLLDLIRRQSVKFRNAERFGLIETNDEPVVFWFENRNGYQEDKASIHHATYETKCPHCWEPAIKRDMGDCVFYEHQTEEADKKCKGKRELHEHLLKQTETG